MDGSRKQHLKRAFDFLTLGKSKWWFLLGFFLCLVVPKTVYIIGGFNQFLLPRGLGYWPYSVNYWVYSGFLPLRFPDTLFQWAFRWVMSDLYNQIGISLVSILSVILLVAWLRGE